MNMGAEQQLEEPKNCLSVTFFEKGACHGIGFCRTMGPVSSTDFRLEISIGQAPDTTAMKFEGLLDGVGDEELDRRSPDPSSIVQYDSLWAFRSGLF
jgi:hypothetical protein